MGASAVATKPIGAMKFMDWNKVKEVVESHPNSIIYAGLMENWNNTSGLIYAKGKYYNGYVYGCSNWATPIVDVDGEEIECWTNNETEWGSDKPSWWVTEKNYMMHGILMRTKIKFHSKTSFHAKLRKETI